MSPPTAKDLNIQTQKDSLSVILINDGKIIKENLEYMHIDKSVIDNILAKQNIKNIKQVLILSANKIGNVYLQEKGKKYQTLTIDINEAAHE